MRLRVDSHHVGGCHRCGYGCRDRHARVRHARDRHARDRHARVRHARVRHARVRHVRDRHVRDRHVRDRHVRVHDVIGGLFVLVLGMVVRPYRPGAKGQY